MPFGLSLAPWAWTKIMRPVLAFLRRIGFTMMGYVDDHGAAAPGRRPVSKADAAKGFRAVTLLCDRLGLSLHPEKGERHGSQVMDVLGFSLDTAGRQTGQAARAGDGPSEGPREEPTLGAEKEPG